MKNGTSETDRSPIDRPVIKSGPVIVGLDERPIEEQQAALRFAAQEADRRHAAIVLAHGCLPLTTLTSLHSGESDKAREKAAKEVLDTAATLLRSQHEPQWPIDVRIGQGTGVDTLLELSDTAGMIVLQRRGVGVLQRWHTGSTTLRVAAEAQCPVVVLRADHQDSSDRSGVVVGVDERGHATVAVETAFAEASLRRAPLVAAHAWQIPGPTAMFGYVPPDVDELNTLHNQAELELAEALAGFGSEYPEVVVRRDVISGTPQQVLDAATARAELLVVGRHSSSRVPTFALGGVARHCIANALCPVMVVPAALSERHRRPRWLNLDVAPGPGY